MMLMNEK